VQLLILLILSLTLHWSLCNLPFVSKNTTGFHCCCVIITPSAGTGCVLTGNTTKALGDTFIHPWSKRHLTRQGGQNEAYWHMWVSEADWEWQGSSERQGLEERSNATLKLPRLTFKLQAAMGSFQEPLAVGRSFDHVEKRQEKKGKK